MNIMCLSARRESACNNIINKYKVFLETHDTINLENVLYTLQTGRKSYEYRWAAVCESREDYIKALKGENFKHVRIGKLVKKNNDIVFAFAGQGSQYLGMGKIFYQNNYLYKKYFDECADILLDILKDDVRKIIFEQDDERVIAQTNIAQPLIFSVEYSLAKTLMDLGIKPKALIGHSLGEYSAACIAGVFALKDALRIVCRRGEMMQRCETGAMLSVRIGEEEIKGRLLDGIEMAAVNAKDMCVVAGKSQDIVRQQRVFESEEIGCEILATSHGFHSFMIEPALDELKYEIENTKLSQPQIPYVSNLTGTWIKEEQVKDVNYWIQHARKMVKFREASNCILSNIPNAIIVETGPGRTMASLISKSDNWSDKNKKVLLLYNSGREHELRQFYSGIMELWVNGVDINWNSYYKGQGMKKVSLPTYCFERDTHILRTKYQNYNSIEYKTEINELYESSNVAIENNRNNISTVYEKPKGHIEINLAGFLEKLLGIKNIGRYDNFFELGGNSMLATQVISWINNQYPINITMTEFFEKSTICELADIVNEMLMEVLDNMSLEELNILLN